MNKNTKKFGLYTAISIVVANMVGTGVFTSIGFQVIDIHSGFSILFLWLIGGLTALFGAFSYAELGSTYPRSGGEYNFLSEIYSPAIGFLSGWISFLVGFAAPVAAASIAFSSYFTAALSIPPEYIKIPAIIVIIFFTILHSISRMVSGFMQNLLTTIKIITIIVFIILGLKYGGGQSISFMPDSQSIKDIFSSQFAIAFYFVSYSYLGWNATTYIIGELKRPEKNIFRSLFAGTLIVILLYLGLNYIFLQNIPMSEMAGKVEIGLLFGNKIFGQSGGAVVGVIFAVLLFATISSMIITGPRVTQEVGKDYSFLRWFSRKGDNDIPVNAILIQGVISLVYVLSSTFEQMITYIGFTLNLFSLLTVGGVFLSRAVHPTIPRPYKTFGYPFVPALFIIINLWFLIYGLIYKPFESVAGLITTFVGIGVFFYGQSKSRY